MIDLDRLERYREDNRLEAKMATGGLPESVWETYSAFANTQGGVILLGVEEYPDKSLHPVDLQDPEWMIEAFWERVNDPDRVSRNVLPWEDIYVKEVDGCHIVVVEVPMVPYTDRPVYVDGDPFTGSYRRSGEGDCRCSREEVLEMYRAAERAGDD